MGDTAVLDKDKLPLRERLQLDHLLRGKSEDLGAGPSGAITDDDVRKAAGMAEGTDSAMARPATEKDRQNFEKIERDLDKIERLIQEYDGGFVNWVAGMLGQSDNQLKRQYQDMIDLYKQARKDGVLSDAEMRDLREAHKLAEKYAEGYQTNVKATELVSALFVGKLAYSWMGGGVKGALFGFLPAFLLINGLNGNGIDVKKFLEKGPLAGETIGQETYMDSIVKGFLNFAT